MTRKVLFATPTYDFQFSCDHVASMMATTIYLTQHHVEVSARYVGGMCFIDLARNDLVKFFLNETDADDIFFVDADIGWDWRVVPRILNSPKPIVGGLAPKRRDDKAKQWHDGTLTGKIEDGLLECLELPTAFMRIKREVFAVLDEAYPEYKHYNTLEHGVAYFQTGWAAGGKEFTGEDIFFCRQWCKLGGSLWLDPDIEFSHRGSTTWKGNYITHGVESGKLTVTASSEVSSAA